MSTDKMEDDNSTVVDEDDVQVVASGGGTKGRTRMWTTVEEAALRKGVDAFICTYSREPSGSAKTPQGEKDWLWIQKSSGLNRSLRAMSLKSGYVPKPGGEGEGGGAASAPVRSTKAPSPTSRRTDPSPPLQQTTPCEILGELFASGHLDGSTFDELWNTTRRCWGQAGGPKQGKGKGGEEGEEDEDEDEEEEEEE